MAETPSSRPPTRSTLPAAKTVLPPDWPTQVTERLVDTVAKVRDKSTRPALVVSRAVVYGLLAAVVGVVAVVLLLVLAFRLLTVYVPGPLWIIYGVLFVLFTVAGIVLLKKAVTAGRMRA